MQRELDKSGKLTRGNGIDSCAEWLIERHQGWGDDPPNVPGLAEYRARRGIDDWRRRMSEPATPPGSSPPNPAPAGWLVRLRDWWRRVGP